MGKSNLNIEYIRKMAEEIYTKNVLLYEDLPEYDLFISQVTDFLNDKFDEENYTNHIVQNYIKSEVISRPGDGKKRGYTKQHLVQLILLSHMRPILTMDEIKKVYRLAFNEINDGCDDIITWEKAYVIFSHIQQDYLSNLLNIEYFDEATLNGLVDEDNLSEKEQERIRVFFIVMTLIAQASSIKRLVRKIVTEYNLENRK